MGDKTSCAMRAKPKKRLGQIFLVDPNAQNKIVESACLKSDDRVLEIGPGKGVVTQKIIPLVRSLVAVELDPQLCEYLNEKFKDCDNFKVVHKDILKLNIRRYFRAGKIKLIGNIPYYISTQILEYLLSNSDYIEEAYLMLQKEFAQRLVAVAADKDRSSLSCFVQYHAIPKILFFVKKGSFWPVPKVDSAFVRLKIRKEPPVSVKSKEKLFKIIRTSFMQRRKTLRNSLSEIVPEDKLKDFFIFYSLDPNIRPQDMSLSDFANLANFLS